jgi:hypothetical protein
MEECVLKQNAKAIPKFYYYFCSQNQQALVTEDTELIPSGIAFRSIGYQSRCVDSDIPFNEKSCTVIPKEGEF